MSVSSPDPENLEPLYDAFNRREAALCDPVLFVHEQTAPLAIETAGLLASALAYGRVAQILSSVRRALDAALRPSLGGASYESLSLTLSGFKHRFTTSFEVASLLASIKRVSDVHGSLLGCFSSHYGEDDETLLPALCGFVGELKRAGTVPMPSLLPCPDKGSGLKRLNLFLRWMVRKDEIDCGLWKKLPASKLIVPLDTHMHRIGLSFGFTKRKQADIKTALEITSGFREICPDDPVRYDFCLTHSSISERASRPKPQRS